MKVKLCRDVSNEVASISATEFAAIITVYVCMVSVCLAVQCTDCLSVTLDMAGKHVYTHDMAYQRAPNM